MSKRFTATENAIEKGLDTVAPAAGAKLIEGWIEELQDADFSGAKGIAADLGRLHKELGKAAPDDETVLTLVGKLGQAATKAAEKADGALGDKVRALGEALTKGGKVGAN